MELECIHDKRKSFYGKAIVNYGTVYTDSQLYSYGTLVAEIKDRKPIIYGFYSQTTKRHIKEYFRQELGYDEVDEDSLKSWLVKEV